MSIRTIARSGSPLERKIGFSRACKVGNTIAVAGTAPLDDQGNSVSEGDVYGQTKRCLDLSIKAIEELGGVIQGVTRTRIMLTDIATWEEAAKAHGELFSDVKPACTFVEVNGFIRPEWLVETEMDCVVD